MIYHTVKKLLWDVNQNIFFNGFEVRIERNIRKSISLIVKGDKLIVRCPKFMSLKSIKEILKKKNSWIKKKIYIKKKIIEISKYRLKNRIFLFKGNEKFLNIVNAEKKNIQINDDQIVISGKNLKTQEIVSSLDIWFKKESEKYFKMKIKKISSRLNFFFNKLIVKDYKNKWGQCDIKNKVIFLNWRLIMAPTNVIDYVIIHELCHLEEPNHSKNFWYLVERFHPFYRNDKDWLNKNGDLLFNIYGAPERI